ncbi:MAG: hypothetical protein LBG15_16435 [Dysgonamonadaceae bacterium]|nr:hypothetical protein [Dysgonamonadaceae bacterium]
MPSLFLATCIRYALSGITSASCFFALTISTGLAILFNVRIPDEEKLMTERFGEQYKTYMKQAKRLIPFIF